MKKNYKETLRKCVEITETVLEKIFDIIMWLLGVLAGLFKMLFAVLVGGLILCVIIGAIVFIKIKPELDECMEQSYNIASSIKEGDFMRGQDTYIYDSEENVIGIINAGHFIYADIEDISPYIQDLYISQEDKRFKEHNGVDWISVARAGLALLKHDGGITQGGSTITQQLIKNTYLTQDQTFTRKIVEILVAPQLEQKFSKPKIMEFYCNSNYYGNRCYGVEAASEYYFGKSASEVSIAEAAMLVGLSNSPASYDPVSHPDEALKKRNSVIDTAVENGVITEEEGKDAKAEQLIIVQNAFPENMETYESTYAVHCAALLLMERDGFKFQYTFENKEDYEAYMEKYDALYGEKTEEVRNGGYKIYTSFVPEIQDTLQEAVDSVLAFSTEEENGKYALQGAGVITDNTTGYVVAIVGGRGTEDQYNRAYLSARQPGSSIKPLLDYAPAFDTGEYYPAKTVNDHKFTNGPSNSGGSYYGNVTIREAVKRSLNTVAWQVLQDIGIDTGLSYLADMKFQKITYLDNGVPALSIGGFTNGLRVVDMVKGYQTLANGGMYDNKTCIVKMLDAGGDTVIDGEKLGKEKVYEESTAYMMTDVLKGVFESGGTASGLDLGEMPAAGKTGTTNSNKDTWFCGYTKYYSAAVWVGYDTPKAMPGVFGSTYAGKIWQNAMLKIHEGLAPLDWEQPSDVVLKETNGITDLYSTHADEVAAENYAKKKEQEALEEAEKAVSKYEQTTVSSIEEMEKIDEEYGNARSAIVDLSDSPERTELYERVEAKYASLCDIREAMESDIEYYYQQQARIEEEERKQAEEEAKKAREKEILETRYSDFESALKTFKTLEYRSDDIEDRIDDLKEKLETLSGSEHYLTCASELEAAINKASELPDYEEYNRIKEEERRRAEEEERRKREEEEAARRRVEEAEKALAEENTQAETQMEVPGPGTGLPTSGVVDGPGAVNAARTENTPSDNNSAVSVPEDNDEWEIVESFD